MKTSSEVFKEVLIDLGFAGYKPSQMTNSDYWLCTTTAMERYAELVKNCNIPDVGNCKTEPNLNRLETELGKLQKVHGEITKHFEVHSGCDSFKFKDGAVYRVKIERNQTKATLD